MSVPKQAAYVVVGAGIHGLSTAYHLAKELRARGAGTGADIVVLDKSRPGAGASGIACGVVRNDSSCAWANVTPFSDTFNGSASRPTIGSWPGHRSRSRASAAR